ncbi:MAG: tRNA (N6-threonylcarbamoyladenosine(37)-N6)-methyltransferase TrmO [Candidatus Sedimenticola endophacoides]
MEITLRAVGIVHSPFKEKFGIPRQSGLVPEACGRLELLPPYNRPEAVAGLEGYSHIWLQFVFHQAIRERWQPTVRPPRLGGNARVGVFASRAPYRTNPIGLSVVGLEAVVVDGERVSLSLSGVDLLDGTPVLDIKPYVAYADSLPQARCGFAPAAPPRCLTVHFSERAQEQIARRGDGEGLRVLITRLLELDPRPAYRGDEAPGRTYGIRLYDFDLRWRVTAGRAEVLELAPL